MAARGVKLLFDENISQRHVSFLAQESRLAEMQHLTSRGWRGTPDVVWIRLAAQQGFVIITGDRNERTRGYTVQDMKGLGAQVVLLGGFWDHMSRWERAKWLVSNIEKVLAVVQRTSGAFVYLMDRYARVKHL